MVGISWPLTTCPESVQVAIGALDMDALWIPSHRPRPAIAANNLSAACFASDTEKAWTAPTSAVLKRPRLA
jgi:hypothetical protein